MKRPIPNKKRQDDTLSSRSLKQKLNNIKASTLLKQKLTKILESVPMKQKLTSALSSIPMKHRLISVLASVPILASLALSGNSCAASCPYGLVNDPYPGQCGHYIDTNGDGICDLSQVTAATTTDASTSDATDSNDQIDANNADVSTNDHDPSNATVDPSNDSDGGFFGDGDNYFIIPLSLILISGYLFTHYLFKKGVLKRSKHRRIWSLLLTAGYLGSSGTGMLLVLLINLGIKTALNPSLIFWHVELSILMVITTLIHFHIHWKSFKNMFRVIFGFKAQLPKRRRTPEISVNLNKK